MLSERAELYAEWVSEDVPAGEWHRIRAAVQRGQLTGDDRFVREWRDTWGGWVSCGDGEGHSKFRQDEK